MKKSYENRFGKRKSKRIKLLTKKMKSRLILTFIAIGVGFLGLSGWIYHIHSKDGDKYAAIVLAQQDYSSKTIPYKRGDIYDRNGNVLATSVKVYNLILDPYIMLSKEDYLEPSLDALCSTLGYSKEELMSIIQENKDSRYIVKDKQLEYETVKPLEEILANTSDYPNVKGIWLEEEYKRKYPYNSLAASTIGFTLAGDVGTWGLEEYYNTQLQGINGRKYGYVNQDNTMDPVVVPATDGNSLVSTIDVKLQSICEKYIEQWVNEYHPDNVAVMLADPNTGEILAMASSKNIFDLNNPTDVTRYFSAEDLEQKRNNAIAYAKEQASKNAETEGSTEESTTEPETESTEPVSLSEEEESRLAEEESRKKEEIERRDGYLNALSSVWKNYCVSDTYEAGSTIKPFTIAGALEDGKINKDDTFLCDGGEQYSSYIHCHKRSGHGMLNVEQAIMNSCNDALMQIAAREGVQSFTNYQNIFGFGMKTGIDLPGEVSAESLIFRADNMSATDLACNSFGQNFNVTMTQMVAGFSSLINGGYYYKPHVVKQILNSNGGVVENIEKDMIKQTVTKDTSEFLKQALVNTVVAGTGKTAAVEGYDVGGKTGTAQKHDKDVNEYILSFLGFAPYDNPQVVCYAIVDAPKVDNPGSSSYACKLFSAVMSEALPYLNVFPTKEVAPAQPETQAPEQVTEPETQAPEPETAPYNPSEDEDFSGNQIVEPEGVAQSQE